VKLWPVAPLLVVALTACTPAANKPDGERFRLERVGPASIQILPNSGQLPYCLAFTASDRGVVRLLTMSAKNEAFKCEANQAVGGMPFRVPPDEGPVRVIVVFADQQVEATPIAAQVREISFKQRRVNGMDLRAPGTVTVESIEFVPAPDP
jgi:hypothetical protein